MEHEQTTFTVDLQPVGRRVALAKGDTLLAAAQAAGIELTALCNGEAWCGKCRMRLVTGTLSALTDEERKSLSVEDVRAGVRLACQARPLSDVKVDIPPDSLTTAQRLQIEGLEEPSRDRLPFDPPVVPVDLTLERPSLTDLQSDLTRLKAHLQDVGILSLNTDLPVLDKISETLRTQDWSLRLALRGNQVVGALPKAKPLLGLAVDIGTTKMAAYLVSMETGETLAKGGATNPQVVYGEDVVSRIAFANQNHNGRQTLQNALVERLNELSADLCAQCGASVEQIVEAAVVGNTAIHHLFLGLPVHQLGEAPYVPSVSDAVEARARDVGLSLAAGAYIYMPPNIAGYVGADHVSMLLAADVLSKRHAVVALDIGTNTEISLYSKRLQRLLSCSCASGPAFEGAHIRDGMRAVPGAIERMQIMEGKIYTHTINNAPAIGLCGSGILDAVAELRRSGVVDETGRLRKDAAGVRLAGNSAEVVLVPAEKSGHGRDVVINRRDVNEVQLAKGAIRAGIEVLLEVAGICAADVEEVIIAGAFGTYLDIANAVRIGMFPSLPLVRFHQVGNAAGMGAKQLLISRSQRKKAHFIASQVEYVELTTHPHFSDVYVNALTL